VVVARWIVAALVAAGGAVMLVSTASPALQSRLRALEDVVPLPLVELGHLGAAAAGLLLLTIARGLARGYRAALRSTMLLLAVAGVAAVLKGLDWEVTALMALLSAALASQSALFDRPSHGAWLERRDVAFAAAVLIVFVLFGAFAHRLTLHTIDRWSHVGYHVESARFLRTARGLALGVAAAGAYVLFRVPVRFSRLGEARTEQALALHARLGHDSTPLMVANGDKDVFFFDDRGLCLYRTVGPYAAVLSDPTLASADLRNEFLDAFFAHCAEIDRRPLFYQVSLDWIPPLHDRGFDFFKLGEEAVVSLDRFTLEGSAGKMNRQLLRRGERDGLAFSILAPGEVASRLPELREVSDDWLRAKAVRERQFSIGFFDERYLQRFPCAVVTFQGAAIVAFANLLEGPGLEELSVDLMRYRASAPRGVMDYLFTALLLQGKQAGYQRFNLGMAPLSSVGQAREAHLRERLAHLLFQPGETWYNFQGLRAYKEKFDPEWRPRYMAYERAWEWAAAITHVSALIAGGWPRILRGA
jgi:phosphatidylglycerol lysyltransferase